MSLNKGAIPREHGSWGFVIEPLLLSLIVAYTFEGLLLALATFFLFLSNQPIKIVLNKSASKRNRSTGIAVFVFYLLIVIALLSFPLFNLSFKLLLPFFAALLIMLLYLFAVLSKLSRNLLVELLPILAMTLVAITIATIDNSFSFNPIIFGLLLISRAVPTVIYINAKVKESRGLPFSILPTHLINILFLLFIIWASLVNLLPILSIFSALLLSIRSVIGFSKFNFTKTIKQIGVVEFIYGSLFVIINGIAFLI
jgi:YwiC-like protein